MEVTQEMEIECLKELFQELLFLVSKAGMKIGLLLLERGFYSVEIICDKQRGGCFSC